MGPHKEAVFGFDWGGSLLVSGDKAGVVGIWDLNRGQLVRAVKTHKGAVSKTKIDENSGLIHTLGLNDGTLACTDMRTNQGIFKQMLHKGAGNDIKLFDGKIATCSADHTINILDLAGFKNLCHVDINDMAFALEYSNGALISATSGGNIVAVDVKTGEILYGYGVMKKG